MTLRRLNYLALTIALVVGVLLLFYLPTTINELFSSRDLAQSGFPDSDTEIGAAANNLSEFENLNESTASILDLAGRARRSEDNRAEPGFELRIEGRIMDDRQRPILNALVTEAGLLIATRSDEHGQYQISIDLATRQALELQFFRAGYRAKNLRFESEMLKDSPVLNLDVMLEDDPQTVAIDGWVGDEIGNGLEQLKIQLSSRDSQGLNQIYSTVFSDHRGYFTLEGIPSGEVYRLSVFSSPEYLFYVDDEFKVTQNMPQLNIVLESLNFVDIDGMIVNISGLPIPNFDMYISNLSTGTHVKKIASDSSGFFNLNNFPAGEVSLTTQGPDFIKISGLTLADNEYNNLRLVVDKGNYFLSGWVSDENGNPLVDAMVQLSSWIADGPIEYRSYRVKGTDSNGRFQFENLGAINHILAIESFGYQKMKFTHRFASQTDEIHIVLSSQ